MIDLLGLLKALEWEKIDAHAESCSICGTLQAPHFQGCQLKEAIDLLESGKVIALPAIRSNPDAGPSPQWPSDANESNKAP